MQQLSNLLDQIRQRQGLKEKKLGIFYRKSKSFLHFHDDPAGTFADLTVSETFENAAASHKCQTKNLLLNRAKCDGFHQDGAMLRRALL